MRVSSLRILSAIVSLCVVAGTQTRAADPDWAALPALMKPAPDTKPGATDIKVVKATSDERNLYLFVEGFSPHSENEPVTVEVGGKLAKFDRAVNRLLVTLDGDGLDGQPWVVNFQDGQPKCSAPAVAVEYRPKLEGVQLSVPLKELGAAPITISVMSQKLYLIKDDMVGLELSFQLPQAGTTVLRIPALPALAGQPKITGLTAKPQVGGVEITWDAGRKVRYQVEVLTPSGEVVAKAKNSYLLRHQRARVVDLKPGRYQAKVTVSDSLNNQVSGTTETFEVPAPDKNAPANNWLSVQGKYIVNSEGNSVRLVGMARCQYHEGHENNLFGSWEGQIAHYKQSGINTIRFAFSKNRDVTPDRDLLQELGPERFVEEIIVPDVQKAMDAGLYVVLDDHHIRTTIEDRYKWIPLWEAIAKRYKDEPRIAMYEPWNESYVDPTGLSPDSAAAIRQWYKDCIAAIRKHDTRHIILVSDWNAGWGFATESMWSPDSFQIDAPYNQVAFSKHMAKDHCNAEFVANGLDAVADRWDVPLVIGELELEPDLQTADDLARLLAILKDDPRNYSVWFWRPHADDAIFASVWAPWAREYATPVDFAKPTPAAK